MRMIYEHYLELRRDESTKGFGQIRNMLLKPIRHPTQYGGEL